jgi:ankyrin repeat protein
LSRGTLNSQLRYAASKGREDECRALLERGADAHAADDLGWTPVQIGAADGHEGICALLFHYGADVHAKGLGDLTLLQLALISNRPSVVAYLLSAHDVDLKQTSPKGMTLEELALQVKDWEPMVRQLMAARSVATSLEIAAAISESCGTACASSLPAKSLAL